MKKYILMLASALCLLLCAVLACMASFARYYSQEDHGVEFRADGYAQLALQMVTDEDGELASSTDVWTTGTPTAFRISNGTPSYFSGSDMSARIRVLLSQGIGDTETLENVTVILRCGDEILEGQRTAIPQGSAMQQSFGDGWYYQFYHSDGAEASWVLPGGEYSCQGMYLTVTAENGIPFDSMMKIEASAGKG